MALRQDVAVGTRVWFRRMRGQTSPIGPPRFFVFADLRAFPNPCERPPLYTEPHFLYMETRLRREHQNGAHREVIPSKSCAPANQRIKRSSTGSGTQHV